MIALLTLKDGVLFRTKRFVPDYRYTSNFVNVDAFDEICFINVGGSFEDFKEGVLGITDNAMVPCSVGGGIASLDDVQRCFDELPCDKVVIETHKELWPSVARKWGAQSCVAGFTGDYEDGDYGEILLQSIERDGSLSGYDLDRLADFHNRSDVPIVCGSGCGSWTHMRDGFEFADGCATSNIFHFTPTNNFRENLLKEGVPLRDE